MNGAGPFVDGTRPFGDIPLGILAILEEMITCILMYIIIHVHIHTQSSGNKNRGGGGGGGQTGSLYTNSS